MVRSKFGNKITYVGDIRFDSKTEANWYLKYRDAERRGWISNLRLQVPYELIPGIYEEREEIKHLKTKDKVVRKKVTVQKPVHYIADFVYFDNRTGKEVVIDVKGKRTKEYILKKKMMRYFKGIEIIEVK